MPKTGLTPEQVRQKALDIALLMMREQGFEKVRLSNVAKAIGVSHAALYAHFKDKEALLNGVIQRWLAEIDAAATTALIDIKNPENRIRAWFLIRYKEKRKRALSDPEPYKAYDKATTSQHAFVEHCLVPLRAELTELLKDAQLGGEIEAGQLLDAMQVFHHPSIVATHAKTDRSKEHEALLDLVIQGLKHTQTNQTN